MLRQRSFLPGLFVCLLFSAGFSTPQALVAEPTVAPKMPATGKVDGVFTGLQEGDYIHFLITGPKKKEMSFFILQPDPAIEAVLDKPERFVGRRCRVYWKESMEKIPEAGGETLIRQIVHLSWLSK